MIFLRLRALLLICVIALFCSGFSIINSYAADEDLDGALPVSSFRGKLPNPVGKYCVLMDANTGKVLWARRPKVHRPPASTTKIAACAVLLQHGHLNDIVTAPPGIDKVPEISLHLKPGEQISLEDLLYAMMLRSANDTPVAGAYYLTGSIEPFVAIMNDVAVKAGCQNTHFVTPNGLYDPKHYSCAYDLALLARYAYGHCPMFEKIVSTQRRVIKRSINAKDDVVKNTSSTFLKTFPGADGVKTGYLKEAGHCFVAAAKRNGWRLIAVVLDSPRCREDCVQMLTYGFDRYAPKQIMKSGSAMGTLKIPGISNSDPVKLGQSLCDILPKKSFLTSDATYTTVMSPDQNIAGCAIRKGEKVGLVTLLKNGKAVMSADLLSVKSISPSLFDKAGMAIGAGNGRSRGIMFANVIGVFAMLIFVSFLYKSFYARTNTKNHRRRRPRVPTNG